MVNNHIHEDEASARMLDLKMRNVPPLRPSAGAQLQQTAKTDADGITFAIRDGHPEDFFVDSVLSIEDNGPWVRTRSRQDGSSGYVDEEGWHLTAAEIWSEILHWFNVNSEDIRRAERLHAATKRRTNKHKRQHQPHRPRAKTFVITERCIAAGAHGSIFDLRKYWAASEEERKSTPIPLVRFSEVNTSFNAEAFAAACKQAKVPDEVMAESLAGAGVWRPFTGEFSVVLTPNSQGFFNHLEFAQETTTDEQKSGCLSEAYRGPMFLPMKIHSRNASTWDDTAGKGEKGGGAWSKPHVIPSTHALRVQLYTHTY